MVRKRRHEETETAVDGEGAPVASASPAEPVSGKKKYRKDKPWDTDDIDHWKIEPFVRPNSSNSGNNDNKNEGGGKSPNVSSTDPLFLEESSFVTLFPKYREHYLREIWAEVTRLLSGTHGIDCELNLVEGSMTVRTTARTADPYGIVKARDLIRLLARSMPLGLATQVLEDGFSSDIVPIGTIVRNKERFVKRRQRLLGPSGNTLRALELLSETRLHVQGNTVAVVGPYKSLKVIRRVVLDCMRNVHPIYHIKQLMIKRELAKDPAMANENWDRFLPKFKKTNPKSKQQTPPPPQQQLTGPRATGSNSSDDGNDSRGALIPSSKANCPHPRSSRPARTQKKQKEKALFPPPQEQSKLDLQLESGEYFLHPDRRNMFRNKAAPPGGIKNNPVQDDSNAHPNHTKQRQRQQKPHQHLHQNQHQRNQRKPFNRKN